MSFVLYTMFEILKGVPNTIMISLVAIIIGLSIGLIFALIRLKRIPVLSQFIIVYNSFFRSTPLIVQLFIVYYGLPTFIIFLNENLDWHMNPDIFSPLIIAFIVFSLHAVAYLSESIKSGLQSVDFHQIEAAQSVGLTKYHIYKEIVLPQAFAYALPNIENQFIMLIKGTSLAFAVQVTEIMAVSHVIANEGYRFITVYSIAALFYWLLAMILEYIFNKMERSTIRYTQTKSI
ncbi:amino acid ABC transporter permease [Staphylococcus edaphicus]|uniref:ABC transporter permease n=1 Tax=Staphylococcus edaphicus TaxID=1955013 RepID=A0A2C6WR29_9STAP|nr:amino acid ABC transporter permease [Staphylococcus edaphicus]PHK50254.1 ABC transporter permease [Staphylococcus edaphicus]UQW82148.1 amino acid ABC transporter permease [Staphylococcus edaphicus]